MSISSSEGQLSFLPETQRVPTRAELAREAARKKARALRYKRPICKTTFENIQTRLEEIRDETADIDGLLWDDETLEELLGSEDEAFEFKIAFRDLMTEVEEMSESISSMGDLMYMDEDDAVATFDLFFPAAGDGDMYGFDTFEGDYYPLDGYERQLAEKEATKRLMRLTKEQLIDTAGSCLRIARQFMALEYRYECLSAALEIIRGRQEGLLSLVRSIEEAYRAAEEASHGFRFDFGPEISKYDQLLRELPERLWIE